MLSANKIYFQLKKITRRLWFRASLYALIGVATAFIGLFAAPFIPQGWATKIGSDSVGNVLSILASSMLAVATFSLSVMVTVFGSVASTATPRASRLLIENQKAQKSIATFIGAFLYSVVGIIALATHAYGEEGRFVLFVVTVLVIAIIVTTLIRWVDQLSSLGRVGDTIDQVLKSTEEALRAHCEFPYLGGRPIESAKNSQMSEPLRTKETGYVTFIDMEAVQDFCSRLDIQVNLDCLPGSFLYPQANLLFATRTLSEEQANELLQHFVIEPSRTFEQDPGYGFVLLSEIATRALSAAVNDPGTVIEVLNGAVRLLPALQSKQLKIDRECKYPSVGIKPLSTYQIFLDLFVPIIRHGAELHEVAVKISRVLKSLESLNADEFGQIHRDFQAYLSTQASKKMGSQFELDLFKRETEGPISITKPQ